MTRRQRGTGCVRREEDEMTEASDGPRVAVITGAGSGMGRACVEHVRSLVDVVVAVDLEAPAIEGTIGWATDIANADAVRALADRARAAGTFRALVHAAGISPT